MSILALGLLIFLAGTEVSAAAEWTDGPLDGLLVEVDWQSPQSLPRRFRNHCTVDAKRGLPYCSDHCGSDYQFYYCARGSFGCCRVGYGYCDWAGLLRCAP